MSARRSPSKRPQSRLGDHESLPDNPWKFFAWIIQRPWRMVCLLLFLGALAFLVIVLSHLASGLVIGMAIRYLP
jgi:hypothetical protein